MSNPELSIVTGKVGRDASFQRLVDSLVSHTKVSWELVVSDASPAPYASQRSNIHVLHEWPRQTCTKGFNAAFRAAKGEWCLYLNDDAEVLPDYDTAAIKFMEAHPYIGLGALHYSEDGTPFHVNSAYKILYGNFGILRRVFGDQIGWMDEELSMYGNDNSLTFRVLQAGKGVADIPEARVIHHSVKDHQRTENQSNRQRDNDTLTRKYLPHWNELLEVFHRYRVDSGREPWVHGMDPRRLRA